MGSPRGAVRGRCGNRFAPQAGARSSLTSTGISKPDKPKPDTHKCQKVHLLINVPSPCAEENFAVFFVVFVEKTLANVGNVWYLMCCQAAIKRCTL